MSTQLETNLQNILNQKETYLLPENLKAGITCLGVIGTYEGGSGDVKLFASVEDMNADPNKSEGDLAIVYFSSEAPVTEDSEFSSCRFPDTVVLPEAFSGDTYASFRPVEETESWVNVSAMLESSRFNFRVRSEGGEVRVQYTSSDGITYTKTEGESEVDFGVSVKFEDYGEPLNENIGYFMRLGSSGFSGLYTCVDNSGTLEYQLAPTQLDVTSDYVFDKTFYGKNGVQNGTMQNVSNLDKTELFARCNVYDKIYNLDVNFSSMNNSCSFLFEDKAYSSVPNFDTSNVTNMNCMFLRCSNLTSVPNFNTSNVTDMSVMFGECYNLTSIPSFNMINATVIYDMFRSCNNLSTNTYANIANMLPIASQLTNLSLLNIGLNVNNFTNEQCDILYNKGYVDAKPPVGDVSNQYIIEYTI